MGKVKEDLQRMQGLGVISCVVGPADWCTHMVGVPKKYAEKVCLCVDLTGLKDYVCRENIHSDVSKTDPRNTCWSKNVQQTRCQHEVLADSTYKVISQVHYIHHTLHELKQTVTPTEQWYMQVEGLTWACGQSLCHVFVTLSGSTPLITVGLLHHTVHH